jgi:hypothetical protein
MTYVLHVSRQAAVIDHNENYFRIIVKICKIFLDFMKIVTYTIHNFSERGKII